MIYAANITTDEKTWQTNLKRTRIKVTNGLVYKVEFFFPSGSHGLMGVAVFDGLYQVWPSTVGEFFVGDDMVIPFDDMYLKDSAPYEFQVYTYNEDETNKHFVAVRIGLVSKELFMARFLPTRSGEYMVELITGMLAEQEAQARLQQEQLEQTVFEWMLKEQMREQRKQKKAKRKERAEQIGDKEFVEVKPPDEPPVVKEIKRFPTQRSPVKPDERLGFTRVGEEDG